MSTTSTVVGIKTIRKIFNYTTFDSVQELKKHIQFGLIRPDDYIVAKVDYNATIGLPCGEPEDILHNPDYYPLKFVTQDGREELWISCVTSGYGGEGPHGTLNCLQMMGFAVPGDREDELFRVKDAHFEFLK